MAFISAAAADCPSLCECKWKNGKESVRCHNANLTEIPPRLDAGTQVLDLQRNEIVRLDGDEFSAINLLNLQKIYLVDCQVTYLHRYAFRNLINLIELDLSDNRLPAVPSHVFDSMAELRELRLSGNPVLRLDNLAFNGLANLVRLELSNCRIRRIELRAFDGVRQSLEWLKLDGNELINVQPAAVTVLNNLHGIELTRNNWNCTCTLRPLREWMLQQNIPYEVTPICAHPERLIGKPWSRLDVDEFACPPSLVAFSSSGQPQTLPTFGSGSGVTVATVTVKAIEGQNVTIGCGIVAGNPDPTIRWMFRNRAIVGNVSMRSTSFAPGQSTSLASLQTTTMSDGGSNGRGGSSSVAAMTTLDTRKKFYHHLGRTATNVTIAWIDSHDSGVYKCIAENAAGRSEAQISVLVYSRHYLIDSNNNVIEASVALAHSNNRFIFIISTVVAALFVLLLLLLAICYYTVHKKNAMAAARMHNHNSPGAPSQPKRKALNENRFHFLLCQGRSESYEKIEMLTRTNPVPVMATAKIGPDVDETSCKIYCEARETTTTANSDRPQTGLGQFPDSASLVQGVQSIQDKRRSMSLNLSHGPSQQRKRRRHGEYYSNVPTAPDDEDEDVGDMGKAGASDNSAGGGHGAKLMVGETSELFTKHQDISPANPETQQRRTNL